MKHQPLHARAAAWLRGSLLLLCACAALDATATAQSAPDQLVFEVAPGTKLLKIFRATHELRIDDVGELYDDLPFVSNKTGGWLSSWQRLEFLDDYARCELGRPLEFRRTIRDATAVGKVSATRPGGMRQEDNSKSMSPLRLQTVRFEWVPEEHDWSRCFDKVDADEEWLDELHGDYDLLGLLPGKPVASGDSWSIELGYLRRVFAPGGNLKLVPAGHNLFGRTMELGVGGDFADFLGADVKGEVKALYKGRRDVALDEAGTQKLECGVIELTLNLVVSADRTQLYRSAMPGEERREPSRLESCTVEYSFTGSGELLWDLANKHFHTLKLEGQEGFVATVWKARSDGKENHRLGQLSRYSGPLVLEALCEDGAGVDPSKASDNPKLRPKKR